MFSLTACEMASCVLFCVFLLSILILNATIPDYGKRSVRHYIDYKFPSAVFAITKVKSCCCKLRALESYRTRYAFLV